jgi:hypothetical protein
MSWYAFMNASDRWQADSGLAQELADLLPETTDDVPVP